MNVRVFHSLASVEAIDEADIEASGLVLPRKFAAYTADEWPSAHWHSIRMRVWPSLSGKASCTATATSDSQSIRTASIEQTGKASFRQTPIMHRCDDQPIRRTSLTFAPTNLGDLGLKSTRTARQIGYGRFPWFSIDSAWANSRNPGESKIESTM